MAPQVEITQSFEELDRGIAPIYNRTLLYYAEREFPVSVFMPTYDELQQAAPPRLRAVVDEFPLCRDGDIELVLDELGIAAIVDIDEDGPDATRMSWSVATTDAWAQDQLKQFSHQDYRTLRQELNINNHWVLITKPNSWDYKEKDFIEGRTSFGQCDRPECWIFDTRPKSIRSSTFRRRGSRPVQSPPYQS